MNRKIKFKRIVIKLGTSTLTAGSKNISKPHVVEITRQVAEVHDLGYRPVLISSGAMAAGREALGFPDLRHLPAKQMFSAVGQPRLMSLYDQIFHLYGKRIAQVLLTREDLAIRNRYLNARNTLEALLDQRIIPIINENDTVATEEIRLGDNDNLSALVANLIEADLLIILTDTKGVFDDDPRSNPDAKMISKITGENIPQEIWDSSGGSVSGLGTGGMYTKISAADLARRSGTTVVIAYGLEKDVIPRVIHQETIGTWFSPLSTTLESRKRYILSGLHSTNTIKVDEGAINALKQGKSLLPAGVSSLIGVFEPGDTVKIISPEGKETAIGLVNYSSLDIKKIKGKQSAEIESILGYNDGDEVIHRNNMVLL